MNNNQTNFAVAIVLIIIIAITAYVLLSATTSVVQTQNSTNTPPQVPNQMTLQSIFGVSGAYNSSTRSLIAPINDRNTLLNVTTAQFNFSTYGPTSLVETLSYPTANYSGYSAASWYYGSASSFRNNSIKNPVPTYTTAALVDGLNYTMFVQQTSSGGIYTYIIGYKGIASVSLGLTSTRTSPVNSTTVSSLIAAVAQAA